MEAPQPEPPRRRSDRIFHPVPALASERRLPVPVATGPVAGNRGLREPTRPGRLNPLLVRRPRVPLEVFPTGRAWTGEAAALAGTPPDVTAEFRWMRVLSPAAARRARDDMPETGSGNQIPGCGGDSRSVELSHAHARMARAGAAEVPAAKTARAGCNGKEAAGTARAAGGRRGAAVAAAARMSPPYLRRVQ